jgi:hypothetical protein
MDNKYRLCMDIYDRDIGVEIMFEPTFSSEEEAGSHQYFMDYVSAWWDANIENVVLCVVLNPYFERAWVHKYCNTIDVEGTNGCVGEGVYISKEEFMVLAKKTMPHRRKFDESHCWYTEEIEGEDDENE